MVGIVSHFGMPGIHYIFFLTDFRSYLWDLQSSNQNPYTMEKTAEREIYFCYGFWD